MSYTIESCQGTDEECRELSEFLAEFIADGEGPQGDPRERTPELWMTRIRAWWETNPFCREDSPLGLVVRTDDGTIVGFFGFIPHDYVHHGEVVRGLIATTSYVREAHRGAALPLFVKAHRQEVDYHFTDGAPNKAIYPILERFGYHQRNSARMHIYPVSASVSNPVRWATGVARLFTGLSDQLPEDGSIITDPLEATSCASFPDSKLRREVTLESLSWYLRSGSNPHYFVGWCDENGILQSYVLGFRRKKSIVDALIVADYAFANEEAERTLKRLISRVTKTPAQFGLPASVSLVVWPTCDEELEAGTPFSREFDPRLFYRLPQSSGDLVREDLPFEGDHIFQ